ncbi:unnamed protein product, partial [Ceratitis capitata]
MSARTWGAARHILQQYAKLRLLSRFGIIQYDIKTQVSAQVDSHASTHNYVVSLK